MNNIGNSFKTARIDSSVGLEEASNDTGIPITALEQIEEGSIGSFKDIFKLKEYLREYAKYLGLDSEKIIDEFNEYMFEYTSKIPLDDIEKQVAEKEKVTEEELTTTMEIKAVTPYLMPTEDKSKRKMAVTIIVVIIIVALVLVWAVKQMMIG